VDSVSIFRGLAANLAAASERAVRDAMTAESQALVAESEGWTDVCSLLRQLSADFAATASRCDEALWALWMTIEEPPLTCRSLG
jgi:hypothetical protein